MNSTVAKILNKYLGQFLENFNKKDLKLSIFSGTVKLNNVRLRPEILDKLGLPFKLKCGYIGNIHVDIPWSHLGSSPIKVTIDKVYILLATTNWVENIEQTRQTHNEILKKVKLKGIDIYEIWIAERANAKNKASFMEKFITKIADNVQLNATNFYIRIEDSISINTKFALGITLNSLSAFTTNSEWVEDFVVDASDSYKLARIDNLAMFLDYSENFHIDTVGSNAEILEKFLEIADKEFELSDNFAERSLRHQFMLTPTSCRMQMHIYKLTGDLSRPGVTIDFRDINVESTVELIQSIRLAKLMETILVFLKFRKGLKEELPAKSMDETEIASYKALYTNWTVLSEDEEKNKQKLKELRIQLGVIEAEAKIADIKMYRKQVRVTFKFENLEDVKRKEIEEAMEKYKQNKLTRLKGFFGSTKAKAKKAKLKKERNDTIKQIEEDIEMIRKAQMELASMSSYGKEDIVTLAEIPPDIFRMKLNICIDSLSLKVNDEKPLSVLSVKGIDLKINQRPTSEQIILKVGSILITDSMIENSIYCEVMSAESFEIMIDSYKENYIKVRTGSFHVVLKSRGLLEHGRIFKEKFVLQASKYGMGIGNTAEKFYEKGQDILINTISKNVKKKLSIDIQLKAPVFYIPYDYERFDRGMLVFDLGEIKVSTLKTEIKGFQCDEFIIRLRRVQALVVWNCTSYHTWNAKDRDYIISPIRIKLNILIPHSDIPDHPGLFVKFNLRAIQFSIQNKVIRFLLKLLDVNKQYIKQLKILKSANQNEPEVRPRSTGKRLNRLRAFREKLRMQDTILSTVINIQLKSFTLLLKDNDTDIFTLKLDTIISNIDITADKLIKIEFYLKNIHLKDNRPEVLFGNILSDQRENNEENDNQIQGGIFINPKEKVYEVNLMVGDIRLVAYPEIVQGLFRVFESIFKIEHRFNRQLAKSIAIKMLQLGKHSQFLNSSNRLNVSLGVRNIEVWVPLNALSYDYDVVQLSLSPIIYLNIERHFQTTYSQQGLELDRKVVKIDDEATLEIRHFGIVIGCYKDSKIQPPSDRVNDFLNPSRISIDYKYRTPDQIKSIGVNLESIMISISLSDIFFFKEIAQNWSQLKSLFPPAKKTENTKKANVEISLMNLQLSCDALQVTLLDISGLSHHAILHTNFSNLSLEMTKDSGFKTIMCAIFMADYYNKSLSCWEPLIENWDFKLMIMKEFKDCPVVLNFKSDSVLNLNLSYALCVTLINMRKSIEWASDATPTVRHTSVDIKKETFTSHSTSYYKIINNLGLLVTVCIEESGCEIWHLQPGESVKFNQGDIEKLRLNKNNGRKNTGLLFELQKPTSIFICIGGYDPVKGVKIEDGNSKSFVVSNGREEIEFMMDVEGHGNLRVLSLQSGFTVMNYDQDIQIIGDSEVHTIPQSESWAVPLIWIQKNITPCIQDYSGKKIPLNKNSTVLISQDSFIYIDVTHYKTQGSLAHTIIVISHALFFHNLIPFPITIHYRNSPKDSVTIQPGDILKSPRMMNPTYCDLKLKVQIENDIIETGWFSILKEKKKISINGELPSLVAEVLVKRVLFNKSTDLRNRTCLDKEPEKTNNLTVHKPKLIQFYFEYILVNKTTYDILIDEDEMLHISKQDIAFMQGRHKNKLKIALKPQDISQISWSDVIDISFVNISMPLNIHNSDANSTAQIAVKIKQAPSPFEKSKIITFVPRFKVMNFLEFPIYFGQYFLDQENCKQNLHCLEPSECLSFEYAEPYLESPLVCLGVDDTNLSYPLNLKKYTDFQMMVPTQYSLNTYQTESPIQEIEFQKLYRSKTSREWNLPSSANNFMHYLRIVVTSDDQATIFINIMHPQKPDYIISNRIDENIEIYQEGCTRFIIPAFCHLPFAFENNFFKSKKLNIKIGDKTAEYDIEKVRKMKPLGDYGVAVELIDYSREVIVEDLKKSKIRRKIAKSKTQNSRSSFGNIKNSLTFESHASFTGMSKHESVDTTMEDLSQEIGGTLLNGFTSNVNLKGIGVSVVHRAMEFVYLSVSNIKFYISTEIIMEDATMEKTIKAGFAIGHIQLDNMNIQGKEFPIILTSYELNTPFLDIYLETKANASKTHQNVKSNKSISLNRIVIKWLECNFQELHLNINHEVYAKFMEIFKDLKDLRNTKNSLIVEPTGVKYGLKSLTGIIDPTHIPCSFDPNKVSRKLYIEKLKISSFKLITSYRNMKKGFEIEFELKKAYGIFSMFSSLAGALFNISNFPLDFNSIEKKYIYESIPKVTALALKSYIRDVTKQLYKLFASSDLIGNPLALYDRIEKGVTELVNEPLTGLKIGFKEYIMGLKYGIASFMYNSISGVSDSLSKITGTLYNLTRQIAGDSNGSGRIEESGNLVIGIYQGVTGGVYDIWDGLYSFVMIPYEQAKTNGTKGFFKGVGKGILGLATCPISASLRLTTSITGGIAKTIDDDEHESKQGRARYPRQFGARRFLEPYQVNIARAQDLLRTIQKYKDELMLFYIEIEDYVDETVILTENNVIVLRKYIEMNSISLSSILRCELHSVDSEYYLLMGNEKEQMAISSYQMSSLVKLYSAIRGAAPNLGSFSSRV